jgi:hypothetical protein
MTLEIKGAFDIAIGGVEIETIRTPKQETAVKINLSGVGRHVIGALRFVAYDGDQPYVITVERAALGEKE